MICVTIGRSRHKMMQAEHSALARQGAQLVELRVDWIAREPNLSRLLPDRPTPVIVTCRRPADGGQYRGSEETRLALLRQAIVSGVEYVDLEEDAAPLIPRYGSTRRIISHHDFQGTPDDLEAIHARLAKLDPDIIKIVTLARSPSDNIRLLELVQRSTIPTIGFCMGDLGLVSRVLCGRFGSPFTYAASESGRALAPGQISFADLQNLYRYDTITAETALYGVLGDPVAHSWSPLLHNSAFRQLGLNAVYLPLRVPADEFDSSLQTFAQLGFRGFSVTIPHKEAALRCAAKADDLSQAIGAANTLVRDDSGTWQAFNTDCAAARECLELGLAARGDSSLEGLKVLLLGAGGVARAIGHVVREAGGELYVSSRTRSRAAALAEELDAQLLTWQNRGSLTADVLVNGTPVGMWPDVDKTPYEAHWLSENSVVFDTIYNPEETRLVQDGRLRGCHVVGGVEMFVRQAAAQLRKFTGSEVPLEELRSILRGALDQSRRTGSRPAAKPSAEEET